MTEVEFHTGVAEPLLFACKLLRKAARQGVRVQVTAPAQQLAALDRALWTFDERDFVPHARVPGASAELLRRTPIWLAAQAQGVHAPTVLVNLGADAPESPAHFSRLIEIVGADTEQAAAGRARWRHYKGLGLTIKHHSGAEGRHG
jgi:DNA polymerase III subunit chi